MAEPGTGGPAPASVGAMTGEAVGEREPSERAPGTAGFSSALLDELAAARPQVLGDRGGALAWVEYLATRALLGGLARLPDGGRELVARGLARVAKPLDRRHSDAARGYLRQALGHAAGGVAPPDAEVEARLLEAWRHFFRVTLEGPGMPRRVPPGSAGEHITVDACPDFERALALGRGGILVTPHVGDWEAGAAFMAHVGMRPAFAISRPPKNRPLSVWMLGLREGRGIALLPRRGGMTMAMRVVREGAWLAMMLDQRPRGNHVVAPLFGRPARCERGAAVMMRRLRVPVVLGACYREAPFRYRTVLRSVLWPEELARLTPEQVVARINAELEALILAHPEQYLWLHDRYRGAPEAADEGASGDAAPDPEEDAARAAGTP